MAYEFRERKHNKGLGLSYCYSDNEDDHDQENDCTFSDPDYTHTRTRRNKKEDTKEDGNINPRRRGRRLRRKEKKPRKFRKLSYNSSNQECSTSSSSSCSRQVAEDEKTVLSWLIKKGELIENERVKCGSKEGIVKRDCVECRCCRIDMNLMEFEIHGGSLSQRPYENIIVISSNKSMLKHLIKIWNKEERKGCSKYNVVVPKPNASDGNDDTCQICSDGGDLICCDDCPSTFHLSCTELERMPDEERWYCPYCKCKYCGEGCSYEKLTCTQCGKSYHWDCFGKRENIDLNKTGLGLFCSSTCREVAEKIQSIIGVKNVNTEGYTWTLIRRMEAAETDDEHTRMECNTKVALACELLNESFKANIDGHTKINILESVVYSRGSNLARMNFSGFYTVILEKNDSVISAAPIRMHSNELADMPFIATREKYRFKGLSRIVLNAVEYVFSCIGIKHLVIPSIQEVVSMWQEKYGFFPVDNEMKKKLMNYNTLNFPGTARLQKTFPGTSSAMEIDQNDENCTKLALLTLSHDHELGTQVHMRDD